MMGNTFVSWEQILFPQQSFQMLGKLGETVKEKSMLRTDMLHIIRRDTLVY